MFFVGTYTHSLDAKKRVFIPAKFREDLGKEFYITRKTDVYLSVYTAEDWENYVEKISSVDVEGIEPTMHGRAIVNAFREDTVRPSLDREAALANAPRRTENEFYLPKIVEGAES